MNLNGAGKMIETEWKNLPKRFSFAQLDEFVIMPNHIHGIIILTDRGQKSENNISNSRGEPRVRPVSVHHNRDWPDSWHCQKPGEYKIRPYRFRPRGTLAGSLGRVIQAFKSVPHVNISLVSAIATGHRFEASYGSVAITSMLSETQVN